MNNHKPHKRLVEYFAVVGLEPDDVVQLSRNRRGTLPAKVLNRYPLMDHAESVFPSGVTLFCFPDGARLDDQMRMPLFFQFVLTGESGDHMYGFAFVFFEPVEVPAEAEDAAGEVDPGHQAEDPVQHAADPGQDDRRAPPIRPTVLFQPKCICLLSYWPFTSNYRTFLTQLYRLSLSPVVIPLERYICNFVAEVPLPPHSVLVQHHIADTELVFGRPPMNNPISWTDLPFQQLFECLDLDNIMLVVNCMLVERPIIFQSTQLSLLAGACEVFSALIYPFHWTHVYIPLLPENLLMVLQAPLPYIIGVQSSMLQRAYEHQICIPDTAVHVDLDANFVSHSHAHPIAKLPAHDTKKLRNRLQACAPVFDGRSNDWTENVLPLMDLAVNQAARPSDAMDLESIEASRRIAQEGETALGLEWSTLPNGDSNWLMVRTAFFRLFVSLLRDHKDFFVFPQQQDNAPPSERQRKGPKFDSEAFLAKRKPKERPFYRELLQTQHFHTFIDDRLHPDGIRDADVMFFEQSIDAKVNRSFMSKILPGAKSATPFLNDERFAFPKTIVVRGAEPLAPRNKSVVQRKGGQNAGRTEDTGAVDKGNGDKSPHANADDSPSQPGNDSPSQPGNDSPSQTDNDSPSQTDNDSPSQTDNGTSSPQQPSDNTPPTTTTSPPQQTPPTNTSAQTERTNLWSLVPERYGNFPTLNNQLYATPQLNSELFSGTQPLSEVSNLMINSKKRGAMSLFVGTAEAIAKPEEAILDSWFVLFCASIGKSTPLLLAAEQTELHERVAHQSPAQSGGSMFEGQVGQRESSDSSAAQVAQENIRKMRDEWRKEKANQLLHVAFDIAEASTEVHAQVGEVVYRALIAACGRCGDVDHATKVLGMMHESGYEPDSLVYSALVQAFSLSTHNSSGTNNALQMDISNWDQLKIRVEAANQRINESKQSAVEDTNVKSSLLVSHSHHEIKQRIKEKWQKGEVPKAHSTSSVPHSTHSGGSSTNHVVMGQIKDATSKPVHLFQKFLFGSVGRSKDRWSKKFHGASANSSQDVASEDASLDELRDDSAEECRAEMGLVVGGTLAQSTSRTSLDATTISQFDDDASYINEELGHRFDTTLADEYPGLEVDLERESCPDCGTAVSNESIRAGWRKDPNDYTTACPQCKRRFVAFFTVVSDRVDWVGSTGKGQPLFCEFLPPWVLIKEVHTMIDHHGIDFICCPDFRTQKTTVFWNLMIYFDELSLPVEFLVGFSAAHSVLDEKHMSYKSVGSAAAPKSHHRSWRKSRGSLAGGSHLGALITRNISMDTLGTEAQLESDSELSDVGVADSAVGPVTMTPCTLSPQLKSAPSYSSVKEVDAAKSRRDQLWGHHGSFRVDRSASVNVTSPVGHSESFERVAKSPKIDEDDPGNKEEPKKTKHLSLLRGKKTDKGFVHQLSKRIKSFNKKA